MNDATHTALCSAHVQLPTDVAAALLSACNPDDLGGIQHKIAVSHRFSGASAVACAKSHPLRAEIIATRTEDVDVQQALLELSTNEMFGKVLRELAKSELVVDHDMVRAVHDRIYQMIRGYDRYSILDRVDLEHALAWLERDATVYGKDLGVLARRVARVLTSTGELAPAIRFITACDTGVPGEERVRPLRLELLEAISSFTKELISDGSLNRSFMHLEWPLRADRLTEPRVRSGGQHMEVRHLCNAYVQVCLPAALHRCRVLNFGSITEADQVVHLPTMRNGAGDGSGVVGESCDACDREHHRPEQRPEDQPPPGWPHLVVEIRETPIPHRTRS